MDEMMASQSEQLAPQVEQLNEQLQAALQVVDDIVLKNYVQHLHDFEIVPLGLSDEDRAKDISENVRLFKITEMVYEKDEFATYKFASVFNALSTANCAVFIIIDSDGESTDFYMGVRAQDPELTPNFLKDTLKNAMVGQFPGIKTEDYLGDRIQDLLDKKISSMSIVSCVANSRDKEIRENKSFVQGLEKLAFAMQGERYTAVILANATSQTYLDKMRRQYETIYSQLAPFGKRQVSYSTNESQSISDALSEALSQGVSKTTSHASGESTSTSQSHGSSHSVSREGLDSKIVKGLATASSTLGLVLAPLTGGASLVAGGLISSGLNTIGGAITKNITDGTSFTETSGDTHTETFTVAEGETENRTETQTKTKGISKGTGQNITFNLEDKTITAMLERIDLQIKRLQEFESLGMWGCSAYFMSEKPYAAEIAASTYKALMRGENSGVEVCAINSWRNYEKDEVKLLSEYVLSLTHPTFSYPSYQEEILVNPCALVSGNELAIHMGLPRKSVCGFPVIEHADFGKEVVSYTHEDVQASINLGHVFNMGSECMNTVRLNRNSLAMHTFVTGSTGSGKSNTIYEMLRQLEAVGVKFMVIEPAKGEYKNVFGHESDVSVYGTNPEYANLLRINPFKFPKGIHVLEHVDRLIEIFNVCWPMYAAMPAVLKEAVLQAYEVCGWDLQTSQNDIDEDMFPSFKDLLTELVDVIENSAYDKEVKSNYKGSLETRIKSLANGLNGQIFSTNEIDNGLLFDQNVIVDLSRIGSLETKSLIMGILVMRLNEYRMTTAAGMNVPLQHVTVLEEAHNILKRSTGTDSGPEGVSVAGKSVEMLSNAIAEMRTYGEGFIIADQSPSAVDISAIRNTNTKVIMRLPDEADRRLAGKAAALKDEQLDEIAKLPRGVAVVYQNDWLEPVLCKVKKFSGEEKPYKADAKKYDDQGYDTWFISELLKLLMKGRINEQIDVDIDRMEDVLPLIAVSTKDKIGIYRILSEYRKSGELRIWRNSEFSKLSELTSELLGVRNRVNRYVAEATDFDELSRLLHSLVHDQIEDVSDEVCLSISQCLMKQFSTEDDENLEIYAAWRESVLKRGGLL